MATTCVCTRPAGDGMLCKACLATLERALAETPFLLRELDVVITRQTTYSDKADGGRSSTKPVPFHVAAADTRRALARALERWAGRLVDTSCPRSPQPLHTSLWLLGQLNRIRVHADAHSIHHEILEPVTRARWLIDRPADRWYAGPCNNDVPIEPGSHTTRVCGAELYATTGRGLVECRKCQATYDVAARRDWLLAAADDHLANAATIARAVSWLGDTQLTPALIRVWAARGRLIAKGHEPYPNSADPTKTRPLYRVGDVIDLVTQKAQKG